MNNRTLKLGFIGGGINSAIGDTHRIASQMDNRWKLEAGCFSKNTEINLDTANKYGIDLKRLYSDWRDFLENEKEKLDAVCILTPTDQHYEMVITAVKLGLAVICEKSMSANPQEAHQIEKIVQSTNGFLAVTFNYSGYPMIRELRKMIQDSKLGKIYQIQIEMPQEGFLRKDKNGQFAKPQSWRLKDGNIPTVSLDLGVHLHHMIYFLTSERPLEVIADQSTFGHFEVIDNVMCIAKYSEGIRAQIWYSKSALGYRNGLRVRVFGELGSAEWYQMNPEELIFNDIYGQRVLLDRTYNSSLAEETRYNRFKSGHPSGFIEAFANHYYDIADSLLEFKKNGFYNSPYVFDAKIAKEGLELMGAISISTEKRIWKSIDTNIN